MVDHQDRIGNRGDEAQLRYLQAAESAAQKRYDDAEVEFIAALQLNPNLYTARFQLGLLQLTCANPDKARITWAALHDESVPEPLRRFARGMEALIVDDFTACIEQLRIGVSLNTVNPALNKDMEMVIARINEVLKANAAVNQTATPKENGGERIVRTDFSLYGKS